MWKAAQAEVGNDWPLFAEGCNARRWYRGEAVEAAHCNDKTAGAEPAEVDDDPGGHLPNKATGHAVEVSATGKRRGDVEPRPPRERYYRGYLVPPRDWTPKE